MPDKNCHGATENIGLLTLNVVKALLESKYRRNIEILMMNFVKSIAKISIQPGTINKMTNHDQSFNYEANDEMHVPISINYVARRYSYINILLIHQSNMSRMKLCKGDNPDCKLKDVSPLLLFCKIYLCIW